MPAGASYPKGLGRGLLLKESGVSINSETVAGGMSLATSWHNEPLLRWMASSWVSNGTGCIGLVSYIVKTD